jgi:CHAT domain-containing protein
VFGSVGGGRSRGAGGRAAASANVDQDLEDLGKSLTSLVMPKAICEELRTSSGLFVEIGMEEGLLEYPWELLHDGEQCFCLKHYVGRFVNLSKPMPPRMTKNVWATKLAPLRVLLVSVASPDGEPPYDYPSLHFAAKEVKALKKLFGQIPGVEVVELIDEDATWTKVTNELQTGKYHIFHFIGHADFEEKDPTESALVLQTEKLRTAQLRYFLDSTPPVLCFVNACDSSNMATGKDVFNTFGLARSILEAGSYLIGSRWKINDHSASQFAPSFYASLLIEGKPIGQAVTEARLACRGGARTNLAWASYVFYGDPRLCFRSSSSLNHA